MCVDPLVAMLVLSDDKKGKKGGGILKDLLHYQAISSLAGCSTGIGCAPACNPCNPHSKTIANLQMQLSAKKAAAAGNASAAQQAEIDALQDAIKALGGIPH